MEIVDVLESDLVAFSHHVYASTAHQLVFFTIPKVACTQWIQLFLRIEGVSDWNQNPHYHKRRPLLSRFSPTEATEIMNSPDWTRAVFLRDPAERLLSAYLDKYVHEGRYVTKLFKLLGRGAPFSAFVELVVDSNTETNRPEGLHAGTDPHWRPQVLIGNLKKFLPLVNFFGNFTCLHLHATKLLQEAGLWQRFAEKGWGPTGEFTMFEENVAINGTNACQRMGEYYTPQMMKKVKLAYRNDYQLLHSLGLDKEPVRIWK